MRKRKVAGPWFLLLFGLVFFAAGALFTWFFSIQTWLRLQESRAWIEVPVVIVESKVSSSSSSDGTTYRPDIRFTYEWEGREYESNSWRLMSVSSSNRSWARGVTRNYPAGSKRGAWMNPDDPSDAVLDRTLGASVLLTFLPLIFVFVGLGIGVFALKAPRRRAASYLVRAGDSLASDQLRDGKLLGLPAVASESDPASPVPLEPRHGRLSKMATMFVFALIWNGGVGAFLGMLIMEGREGGHYEWFPIIFLSVFALIGVVVLIAFFYTLLGFLLGPRVRVAASSRILEPGDSWEISWQFYRGSARIQEFRITLEGQTEADYTSGSGKNSSRVTDKKVFLRRDVFLSSEPGEIVRGQSRIELPANLPHSFEATNNRLRYHVVLVAAVAWMPNLREEYPVFVLPSVSAGPRPVV